MDLIIYDIDVEDLETLEVPPSSDRPLGCVQWAWDTYGLGTPYGVLQDQIFYLNHLVSATRWGPGYRYYGIASFNPKELKIAIAFPEGFVAHNAPRAIHEYYERYF